MSHTSVPVNDELIVAVRLHAERTGRTLTQFLEDSLRRELRRLADSASAGDLLPTYRGEGVRPGIDLHDVDSLEDAMILDTA
jgi:hypothetical protein